MKHLPLTLATVAIVVTQITCTCALIAKLDRTDGSAELVDISSSLRRVSIDTFEIARSGERTARGTELLGMTQEERARALEAEKNRPLK
jgi:hypothetical protein